MKYFGLWSLAMFLVGAVLMLAYYTNTSWSLALFFFGAGVVIGGIALARRISHTLREHDPHPANRDRPWPGAEGFP